jgi:hypothetical protein
MPGVQITTAVRTGPAVTGVAPDSTFFVVGETQRGKQNTAVLVTSLDEYVTQFGGYEADKHTYNAVRIFFEEGGANCYVSRAANAAWDTATVLVEDATDETKGITVSAAGSGEWGNDISVVVSAGDGVFNVEIQYGADNEVIASKSDLTTIAEAIEWFENSTAAKRYVQVALAADTDDTNALGAGTYNLSGGTNEETVAVAGVVSALAAFTEELGGGCVAAPGFATGSDTTLYDALKNHAVSQNRIALLSFKKGETKANAISNSESYGASDDTGHENVAMYFPWVTFPSGTGVTLSASPEAYVAAVRSKTHNSTGPWKAYAGVESNSRFVTGVATALSKADGDELDAARVNPIRIIANDVRIYGARSHAGAGTATSEARESQWRFITARETINYVVNQANIALEPLVFSTIDGRKTIYADITAALQSVLEPVRIAGGLYEGFSPTGKRLDYGYTIKVDDTLNPASQLESGLVKAQVGIRVSSIGDKITVNIIKSNLTTALV